MKLLAKYLPAVFVGADLVAIFCALLVVLWVRYGEKFELSTFMAHVVLFLPIVFLWILVFFVAGLYERRATLWANNILGLVVSAQMVNGVLAVVYFYLLDPYVGITPKTILLMLVVLVVVLVFMLRWGTVKLFSSIRHEGAVFVGEGEVVERLIQEIEKSPVYGVSCAEYVNTSAHASEKLFEHVSTALKKHEVRAIALDFNDPRAELFLPHLYPLLYKGIHIYDVSQMYEDFLGRVALSSVKNAHWVRYLGAETHKVYFFLKRLMDILGSLALGVCSLWIYPLVALAIKLEDRGTVFITQERVGEQGRTIQLYKFRSMSRNERSLTSSAPNKITNVGAFMRKTRIDELPQLWNVLRGDLSLVGPRPELVSGVQVYEREIPYYSLRHLVRPGLSGWAQLYHQEHPHHGLDIKETRNKLSYDLYYIKHQSFVLDVVIALKTLKTLLLRKGS